MFVDRATIQTRKKAAPEGAAEYFCSGFLSSSARSFACGLFCEERRALGGVSLVSGQLHPVVEPQLSHFMQVPLRTRVKFPHSPQGSPS